MMALGFDSGDSSGIVRGQFRGNYPRPEIGSKLNHFWMSGIVGIVFLQKPTNGCSLYGVLEKSLKLSLTLPALFSAKAVKR